MSEPAKSPEALIHRGLDHVEFFDLSRAHLRDLDTLLRELAGEGALPSDQQSLQILAKKWLVQKRQFLRETLCGNETIRQLTSTQETLSQRVDLVVAICDLLSSVTIGVAPWTVGALLGKEGLRSLCQEDWNCDTTR